MARRIESFRGLAQASRLRVMYEVLHHPGVNLAELSRSTGLHENTLRDHLRVLEAEGFITLATEHRPTRGRPRTVYHPVDHDSENPVAQRRIEDAKNHGDLLRRILPETVITSPLDADAMHQIDALYEHLDDVGLEPDIDETTLTIALVPCPFHNLLDTDRNVVCAVHEKLIESVLGQAGGPIELDRLLPFTTAHSCHAHLRLRDSAPTPAG